MKKKISALILKRGKPVEGAEDKVEYLIQFSRKHAIPILEVPFEISFRDVMSRLMERLFNEEVTRLKYFKTTHDNFSALVLGSESIGVAIDQILDVLAKLIRNPVAAFNRQLDCIGASEGAERSLEIQKDVNKSYDLTRRWNMCLVVTDGSAILGLGNIGPEAGMPVMEGKCALFKAFGDVDAFPLCIKSNDVDEIVNTIYLISGSFGGVNLEDISAPRCFEIEKKLKEKCDIPIFHDDQHGTAIVVSAGLTNALRLVGKKFSEAKVVINGAGSAGISICKLLLELGIGDVVMVDRKGILAPGEEWMNPAQKEIAEKQIKNSCMGTLRLP